MATLAPYSAKRTVIAWPIPELPPVTSTFLPSSPLRPGVRFSFITCSMAVWSDGGETRYTGREQRAGHGRGEVDPQVGEVGEGQCRAGRAGRVEAGAGEGRALPGEHDDHGPHGQ